MARGGGLLALLFYSIEMTQFSQEGLSFIWKYTLFTNKSMLT